MNYNQNIPRDPYTSLIRSRYPQVHGNKCRCNSQSPISREIEALKSQNMLLRSRMTEGLDKGERQLSEDRVRLMELENRKLHDKIIQYQRMMEELEKTHMELVSMVKAQQHERMQQSARNPGSINQSGWNGNRNYQSNKDQSLKLEGDYLISLKKVRRTERSQSKSPEEREQYSINFQSTQKRGLKNSFNASSEKKQNNSNAHRMNPEYESQYASFRNPSPDEAELRRANQKIKYLQSQLQQKDLMRTENRIIANQNENLKNKVKSIEENIKSYEESIKHYQLEINRLKIFIDELKAKQVNETVMNRQNDSLKNSNDYLKQQISELELEIDKWRIHNQTLTEQIQKQKQISENLRGECQELNVFARESQKQKKTINLLNQEVQNRNHQLLIQQTKVKKYQNMLKQILQIRQMVEKVDLSDIQHEERRLINQHKSKHLLLNNQVNVLTHQLERFKQEILILEEKIAELTATKQILTSSLQFSNKQNQTLINQIRGLEDTIQNYLREEPLPSLRVTTVNEQIHHHSQLIELRGTKQSLAEVIQRLEILEERMERSIY